MAVDLQLRAAFARSIRDANAATETGGDPSHKVLLAEKGKKGLGAAFRLLRQARTQVGLMFSLERVVYYYTTVGNLRDRPTSKVVRSAVGGEPRTYGQRGQPYYHGRCLKCLLQRAMTLPMYLSCRKSWGTEGVDSIATLPPEDKLVR